MLSERLATARRQAGLTQAELAEALGERYDQTTISAVERGRSSLRLDGVVGVARALGLSADWLLGLTDDPTPVGELAERSRLGKELAQHYLSWRRPGLSAKLDLADDRRRKLERKLETAASELVVLHRGQPDLANLARPVLEARSRGHGSGVGTQPSPPAKDGPVSDRRLAELLAALASHWKALGTRYARDTWIADVYRWCPPLRSHRSALRSQGLGGD